MLQYKTGRHMIISSEATAQGLTVNFALRDISRMHKFITVYSDIFSSYNLFGLFRQTFAEFVQCG